MTTPAPDPAEGGLSCARCRRPVRFPTRRDRTPAPDPRGRGWSVLRRWPDGLICSGCYARACETYGVCDGCSTDRLLPGRGSQGQRWCTDCAGGMGDFTCIRCGQEGWNHYKSVCGRCVLIDRLAAALDDGTGQICPQLVPLADWLAAMSRPRSGILWLTKTHVQPILTAIAHHRVPLTHEGVATLTPWRSVIHVRDLLVACGILLPVDRFLFLFEQWLPIWLDTITDSEHRQLLHLHATWHVLRQLRHTAASGPIGHYRHQSARHNLRVAAAFLDHLAEDHVTLATCTQGQLDDWHAHHTHAEAASLRPLLRWAITGHHMPRLRWAAVPERQGTPISHRQWLELIRRVHDDDGLDLTERVLSLLILLYAQSLDRISRLTIDDVITNGQGVSIRLGTPPSPVPPPFDRIVTSYLAARPSLITATNPGSRWLFPGRSAGQPLHPTSMRRRLHRLGIPNLAGRRRALRDLVLQAPPSVVARMLGYSNPRTENLAIDAGTTWRHYAPGDHNRTRQPTITP